MSPWRRFDVNIMAYRIRRKFDVNIMAYRGRERVYLR